MTSLRQTFFSKWHSANGGNDTNFYLLFNPPPQDMIKFNEGNLKLCAGWEENGQNLLK